MTWFNVLKNTATATRSADLWAMNDYDFYQRVMADIKEAVRQGLNKEEIIQELAKELPDAMANVAGFMDELTSPVNIDDTAGDGITDVDWEEVARNFEEDIDTIIEDLRS